MQKINIIHFDPYIGGETTLCNSISVILRQKFEVRVLHPIHLNKKGKPIMNSGWGKVEGGEYLPYDQVISACDDADFIFCLNAKHVKGSVKSDKRALSIADALSFFDKFENKNFIFYEHGFHTWRLYDYGTLFPELMKKGNTIRVLTNTKMAIEFYKTKGYNAYLCRQPFNPDFYNPITKNDTAKVNICFNSRYSSTKGPHVILKDMMQYFDKGYNFNLFFRGNIGDPVSVWHNVNGVLLKDIIRSKPEIVFRPFAIDISEVYDKQDFTIYAGYLTKEERGKMEYSVLESIFYDIPMIAHSDVFTAFKYEEYDVTPEQLKECFIELTEENMMKIINKEIDGKSYAEKAKVLLNDFLPDKILERFEHCLNSPVSEPKKTTALF